MENYQVHAPFHGVVDLVIITVIFIYLYNIDATPFLRLIRPNSGPPNSLINWIGLWRVSNTNEIKRMKIGDINCERFTVFEGINNLNDDTNID